MKRRLSGFVLVPMYSLSYPIALPLRQNQLGNERLLAGQREVGDHTASQDLGIGIECDSVDLSKMSR
jgi:hypothetical protein